eukprot:749579-Hanusia_phi.AAC.2
MPVVIIALSEHDTASTLTRISHQACRSRRSQRPNDHSQRLNDHGMYRTLQQLLHGVTLASSMLHISALRPRLAMSVVPGRALCLPNEAGCERT